MLLLSTLLGMYHVRLSAGLEEDLALFADFEMDYEPIPFTEAIEALRTKIVLDANLFSELDAAIKLRSFTVSRLAGSDAIKRLQEIISRGMEEGQTLAGFIESAGSDEIVSRAGFSNSNPYYWENVLRTNQSTAYSLGREMQFEKMGEDIEVLEFVGIDDQRQTDICSNRDGTVLPANDPWWLSNSPPLHYQCRSTKRAILKGTSEASRVVVTTPEQLADMPAALDGFGASYRTPADFARIPDAVRERAQGDGLWPMIVEVAVRLGVNP